MWALKRQLPQLYREFNGIDFGHAHLAETLLQVSDQQKVEKARAEVLNFIFSSPGVAPDEELVAPAFSRLVWEVHKSFTWAHSLHRSLYDLFVADRVVDKDKAYRKIMNNYLSKPEAITTHVLDHHGKLWSWPESRAFRDRYPAFNSQIWAYHWLQAAAYDVQLMGNSAVQRKLLPGVIAHYHGYLRSPPVQWKSMPMMAEAAPEFARKYPEASAIFDNLHMLHDNIDDVLSSPEIYPTDRARRQQILKILAVYLHRNHVPDDKFSLFHAKEAAVHHDMTGERPPSVAEVLGLKGGEREKTTPKHEHGEGAHTGH
jgi:hypothetical protein